MLSIRMSGCGKWKLGSTNGGGKKVGSSTERIGGK
jgi:hypothetical protein